MNLKRVITGLMFAGLGSMAFLAACDPEGTGCTFDSECLEDEICYQNVCRQTCETQTDCFTGEECVPGRGDVNVCMPEAQTGPSCAFDTDCAEGLEVCVDNSCTAICSDNLDCSGDLECRERPTGGESVCQAPEGTGDQCTFNEDCPGFDDGELCLDGQCVFPGVEYFTVRIVDQTTDATRCADTTYDYDTPGAKMMYIALLDADDTVLHYAETVDFIWGDPAADFGDPFEVINGLPPSFEGQCPNNETFTRNNSTTTVTSNFHEDAVVALGCGGELFVQFKNTAGNLVNIDESHKIEVNAYGSTCNAESETPAQSQEDPYDIEICTDSSSTNIDIGTCYRINDDFAQGRVIVPVEFAD